MANQEYISKRLEKSFDKLANALGKNCWKVVDYDSKWNFVNGVFQYIDLEVNVEVDYEEGKGLIYYVKLDFFKRFSSENPNKVTHFMLLIAQEYENMLKQARELKCYIDVEPTQQIADKFDEIKDKLYKGNGK